MMSPGGRQRIFEHGTTWQMVPIPTDFAEALVSDTGLSLREAMVEMMTERAVRFKMPWNEPQEDEE